jgi:hypothetical protein
MSIGSVAFNDPVSNFFKAVETARQRNLTAFEHIKPMTKFDAPGQVHAQKTNELSLSNRPYANKTIGVNTAPAGSAQSSQQVRTRILGNFFDAYA